MYLTIILCILYLCIFAYLPTIYIYLSITIFNFIYMHLSASINPSIHPCLYWSSIHPSFHPFIHPSIHPSIYISIYVSIYVSIPINPLIHPSLNPFLRVHSFLSRSFNQSIHPPSTHPFLPLSLHLSIIYQSIFLYVSIYWSKIIPPSLYLSIQLCNPFPPNLLPYLPSLYLSIHP